MGSACVGVQGSGWGWLGWNPSTGALEVATTANQDPLKATTGLTPLLGIDVWEHAYYLQYRNVRPDYLREIWKVVNWQNVSERLAAAQARKPPGQAWKAGGGSPPAVPARVRLRPPLRSGRRREPSGCQSSESRAASRHG